MGRLVGRLWWFFREEGTMVWIEGEVVRLVEMVGFGGCLEVASIGFCCVGCRGEGKSEFEGYMFGVLVLEGCVELAFF